MAATLSEMIQNKGLLPRQWHLDSAPQNLLRMILGSEEGLGDGSFSEVIAINAYQVLKVTTCEASNVILPKLIGKPAPGLPLVFKDFGVVGRVEGVEDYYDDIPLRAYLMERLYRPRDLKQMRRDYCPRGNGMRARSLDDAEGARTWLKNVVCKGDLFEGNPGYKSHCRPGLHPVAYNLERRLAGTRFRPLAGTVQRLAPRVLAGEWTFDWLSYEEFDRNVMLSLWGEPILADPVYDLHQPRWQRPYPWMWQGTPVTGVDWRTDSWFHDSSS